MLSFHIFSRSPFVIGDPVILRIGNRRDRDGIGDHTVKSRNRLGGNRRSREVISLGIALVEIGDRGNCPEIEDRVRSSA